MIDERELFGRAIDKFSPPARSFDRLIRRRDRKRRNRRIGAAVVALGIFVAVIAYFGASIRDRTELPATPAPSPSTTGWIDVTPAEPLGLGAVAASDLGFVAVGETDGTTDPILYSPDGRSWSPVPCAGSAVVNYAISGGPGFIAVGLDADGYHPAAFFSSDGRTWEQAGVTLPSELAGDGSMFGVLPTDAGFIAWGRVLDGDAYVLTSSDGLSWRPIPDESAFAGAGERSIFWIGRGPDGFVAGGYERPSGSRVKGDAVAWTSTDGVTWVRIANITWDALHDLRSSVAVPDRSTASGPTGSVKIDLINGTIRFRSGGQGMA